MPGTMRLLRGFDGSLISDAINSCQEAPDHVLNRLKTLNNVSFIQPQGRLEWGYETTFLFCDFLPGSTVAGMRNLIRHAHNREWLRFRYRDGLYYDVRVAEEPEIEKEDAIEPVYYVTCVLLKRGFEA